MAKTRVLLADDHKMFRDGLRRLLEEQPTLEVVAEAGTAAEALTLARESRPDLVLLDVAMPGRDSLEILGELKRNGRGPRVLMLTSRPESEFAIRCLRAGADGYLTKGRAGYELIEAIDRVLGGRKYISSNLAEQLAGFATGDLSAPPHERLSDRELQVLRLLAAGKSVSEIGGALFLSPKTVSTYRARILEKLNLKTNAELVRYALEHHLID